jgi:gamma-glutamylputrescine oxidase
MILQNWWYTTLLGLEDPIQQPLKGHLQADVLIVGGGAAGLSAALALMDQGLKIVLLERNICGGSSTGKSAGFLTPDSELELSQLLWRFGPQGAQDLWGAATRGVELMRSAIERYEINCDLVKQDSLFLGNGHSGWRAVQEEAQAHQELGYPQRIYTTQELTSVLGSTSYRGGVRYSGTFGINPLRYAQGVKRVLLEHGVQIHEASEAIAIDDHRVQTHLGTVTSNQIIFCSDKLKPTLTRFSRNIYHAQTFLAISEPLEDEDISAVFPDELLQCWDSDLVYTYYRLTGDGRLLVGGGSKLTTFSRHDVTTPQVIHRVLRRFKRNFPGIDHVEFIQYWPGRIDTTRDLLPTVLRVERSPWIHYVLGCVGLPWATFCGDFAGRHILCDGRCEEHKYYRYFSVDRGFLLPLWLQKLVGKQLLFSINNAWAKYYQVGKGKDVPYHEERF